jgi:GWxTD domain-containing protein
MNQGAGSRNEIRIRAGERAVPHSNWRAVFFCLCWCMGFTPATAFGGVEDVAVEAVRPDSLVRMEAAVNATPKDGEAWVRLGHAYLSTGELKKAEKAFKKGVRYARSARAHYGLGLALMQDPLRLRLAVGSFKRALRIDPTLIDAQMSIVQCYIEGGYSEAEKALKRAIEMDSTYAPAYLKLAEYYQDEGLDDRVIEAFQTYLSVRPTDADGHYGLALTYIDRHRYDLVLQVAEATHRAHPNDARFLALLGQAYAARGDAGRALEVFEEYLRMIPEKERALYLDLSLVALPDELKAYQDTAPEEREVFLKTFWSRHDPTMVSDGDLRRAEHYRRVWYARTHFAEKVEPWDKRGEVYIRYGEPDYRSRSGRANPLPSLAVEAVKEQNAFNIYERGEYPEGSDGETIPDRLTLDPRTGQWQRERTWGYLERRTDGRYYWMKPDDVESTRWIEPTFPIVRNGAGDAMVAWESWVYTRVGRGVEFAFTDEMGSGKFKFAPIPPVSIPVGIPTRLILRPMPYYSDGILVKLKHRTPERYSVPPGVEPLDFHYDFAAFRGSTGRTRLEVYYGIVPDQVSMEEEGGRRLLRVDRAVALKAQNSDEGYRAREVLTLAVQQPESESGFIPDVTSLQVPPGKYKLAVQLSDQVSGKWNIYLQDIEVPAFGDGLAMSDLEMAWTVSKDPWEAKYKKDDLWVVPMPTRAYRRNQPTFVYYEVYNLTKDDFGRTKYRIDYAIRHHRKPGVLGSLRAGLGKLRPGTKPEVTVSYERDGDSAWEPIYLELETAALRPGWSQVAVTVTDLNRDQTVSKTALFRLDGE